MKLPVIGMPVLQDPGSTIGDTPMAGDLVGATLASSSQLE